jgi:HD-like signal output (HDOD) protein
VLAASLEYARRHGVSLQSTEQALLDYTDADLDGVLARHWQFPLELVEAIRCHAMPLDQLPDPRILSAFVLRARMLARSP